MCSTGLTRSAPNIVHLVLLYKLFVIYSNDFIAGSSELHNVFLRRTNDMEGVYFAELVKELFTSNEKLDVHTETGISLYGRYLYLYLLFFIIQNINLIPRRKFSDWDYLGWWINYYKVDSPNNRYI